MNLGVETLLNLLFVRSTPPVSAFSDESWGGDPCGGVQIPVHTHSFSIL